MYTLLYRMYITTVYYCTENKIKSIYKLFLLYKFGYTCLWPTLTKLHLYKQNSKLSQNSNRLVVNLA